ncbi:uncharacterized protein Z520_05909 [Fonsecaea multimorphosa CBS 102226]|uniref:L-lactate dehydrogenase n=1 Tax=Fonsecaea multimorphosa CBS 102226 TaxID=1442371 RepID=A0A0D2KPF8_9EURO|nr:uncharacterized protein Z520_05909 [Fonsecaea multimorphosa CBS 102226]KIX98608.1 hypothetical protein Z520_05909 [Fonsecaea multimorphosa CBS 102226]OAL24797.1 hypothetical protein AYO22_05586 [Fonsecaea multimorphosa]
MLSIDEVRKHNYQESCWVIIHGFVYDLSDFLDKHPGGAASILRYAGKDATEEYDSIHPPNTIDKALPKDRHLGQVEQPVAETGKRDAKVDGVSGVKRQGLLPIETCLNLNDLELAAKDVLSERAWIYYSSAAQDRRTLGHNLDDWKRIRFRPRVMRNVKKVNTRRTILGFQSSLPFFIAPCALARLGNPDGELCLVRGAARANIPYCPSNSASVSHDALADCLASEGSGGCLFFQLYVKRSQKETLDSIRRARDLGYKALVITVDTNVVGIREDDDNFKIREALKNGQQHLSPWRAAWSNPDPDAVLRAPHSSTLNWEDLHWIKDAWQNAGPICLKGILAAEDAQIACDYGVDAIYLSNHGGRQLDSATSALAVLMEIRRLCPEVLTRCQVLLDGGVRRGGDILKALCLGAAGVGLGRPFMYALSAYGTEGVHKAIEMLSDEIETGMRLLGATSLDDLSSCMVNTRELEILVAQGIPEWESGKSRL